MSDLLIADHGSIISIVPNSEAALKWIDENLVSESWQRFGGALYVDRLSVAGSSTAEDRAGFAV